MACSSTGVEFSCEELKTCIDTYKDRSDLMNFLKIQFTRVESTLRQKNLPVEFFRVLLAVLSYAVLCDTQTEYVVELLNLIKDSNFLLRESVRILRDGKLAEKGTLIETLFSLKNIVEQILLRMPSSFVGTMGLIEVMIMVAEHKALFSDDAEKNDLNFILVSLSAMKNDLLKDMQKVANKKVKPLHTDDPPNDFRSIPILPSTSDIFPIDEIFLRRNISKGAYSNLEHYLDVQFRLYREDCVSPLRDGITDYLNQLSSRNKIGRLENVRLYKNVQIACRKMSLEGEVYTVQLDRHYAQTIKWAETKRLLYGSLVCLSNDDFKTLLFGIVNDSDRKTLQSKGSIKVQFSESQVVSLGSRMHMMETTAYFEAYRHVLKGLKAIKDGELPFESYIVHCRQDVLPPLYITTEAKYDFGPIISNTPITLGNGRIENWKNNYLPNVPALLSSEWPTGAELHLNESQYEAFRSALTKEFVLIQGPPGTGKTHLGIQIAKVLLHNRRIWNEETGSQNIFDLSSIDEGISEINPVYKDKISQSNPNDGTNESRTYPMLVVCFTNHALDQFLEGILQHLAYKPNVIRVGGGCQNPYIEQFSLRRRRCYANTRESLEVTKELLEDISHTQFKLEMSYRRVLDVHHLRDVFEERFTECFIGTLSKKKKYNVPLLFRWLGVTKTDLMKKNDSNIAEDFSDNLNTDFEDERETEIQQNKSNIEADTIDIETEADFVENDRRIEPKVLITFPVNPRDSGSGLDVMRQMNKILKKEAKNLENDAKERIRRRTRQILNELNSDDSMEDSEVRSVHRQNIWKLNRTNRWRLYRYWLFQYRDLIQQTLHEKEDLYKRYAKAYKTAMDNEDTRILREATIIAMTTTGAARYQSILRDVSPKIIIIEEAAEVLEAHIITSLTPKCEHLILIGDHKQLEPKPAVYELAVKYNLALSMFERMIKNDLTYHVLQRQHRMRPEIAKLLRHIYPQLVNNDNVMNYEHVKGIRKDVFFIEHENVEQYSDDSKSFSNKHEAEFIIRLCKYLLQQGYKASQITVLTAYAGQMFCMKSIMPKSEFEGVRLTVVDNYQGEENDIVLLSLVRSNPLGDTGFLKRENRICVALSRAKKGLFVIGNFRTMRHSSDMWKKIVLDLQLDKSIGKGLPLYCTNHPDGEGTTVREPKDFTNVPEGGCSLPCDIRLPCGHACRLKCHPYDLDHREYKCHQLCLNKCEFGHKCKDICHYMSECKCTAIVSKSLSCGHKVDMKCSEKPTEKSCKEFVIRELKCGHDEIMKCWENANNKECTYKVKKRLPCGHIADMKCSVDPSYYKCNVSVDKELPCTHTANMHCNENTKWYKCWKNVTITFSECGHEAVTECFLRDSFEEENECLERVEKIWPCGHREIMECCLCETSACQFKCMKVCQNGHVCEEICHFPSDCKCRMVIEKEIPGCMHIEKMECHKDPAKVFCRKVVRRKIPKCGHLKDMMCFENPSTILCDALVKKRGHCGHLKNIKCCVPADSRICKKIVDKKLPGCGHILKIPCSESLLDKICAEFVDIKIPACGHYTLVRCCNRNSDVLSTSVHQNKTGHIYPLCTSMTTVTCPFEHSSQIRCCDKESFICSAECNIVLTCGHKCKGSCSQCLGGTIHKTCGSMCERRLSCGHWCKQLCGECIPCQKKCERYCSHSRCTQCCTDPCLLCNEPCDWSCFHFRCNRLCHEPCDRPRCNETCMQILQCGHKCLGYCGEPCPQLCRVCGQENLKKFQQKYGSRKKFFVVKLVDCRHEFEASYLDKYVDAFEMEWQGNTATFKQPKRLSCPECNTVIIWHPRYNNIIKHQNKIVQKINSKIMRHPATEVLTKIPDLILYINAFQNYIDLLCSNCRLCCNMIEKTTANTKFLLSYLGNFRTVKTISEQQVKDINRTLIKISLKWLILKYIRHDSVHDNDSGTFGKNAELVRLQLESMLELHYKPIDMERKNIHRSVNKSIAAGQRRKSRLDRKANDVNMQKEKIKEPDISDSKTLVITCKYADLLDTVIQTIEKEFVIDVPTYSESYYQGATNCIQSLFGSDDGHIDLEGVQKVPLLKDIVDVHENDYFTCGNGHHWHADQQRQCCTAECHVKTPSVGNTVPKEIILEKQVEQNIDTLYPTLTGKTQLSKEEDRRQNQTRHKSKHSALNAGKREKPKLSNANLPNTIKIKNTDNVKTNIDVLGDPDWPSLSNPSHSKMHSEKSGVSDTVETPSMNTKGGSNELPLRKLGSQTHSNITHPSDAKTVEKTLKGCTKLTETDKEQTAVCDWPTLGQFSGFTKSPSDPVLFRKDLVSRNSVSHQQQSVPNTKLTLRTIFDDGMGNGAWERPDGKESLRPELKMLELEKGITQENMSLCHNKHTRCATSSGTNKEKETPGRRRGKGPRRGSTQQRTMTLGDWLTPTRK